MNAETGAATDAIESIGRVGHDRKPQERQKLRVEGAGGREISRRDKRMGNTVDFPKPLPASSSRIGTPAYRRHGVARPAMRRIGIHARMPHRRYHDLRRGDREFEAFKA